MARKRSARRANQTGRNDGDGRHVRLYFWMLTSEAWRALNPLARALYVEMATLFNGSNNGDLFLSVRDAAERLGIGKSSASRAFHNLVELGFIRPNLSSGFDWKARQATCWVLAEHAFAGQPATKEFMRQRQPEKKSTVPPQVQTVPSQVQIGSDPALKVQICPIMSTDKAKTTSNLSRQKDADSLPRGGRRG